MLFVTLIFFFIFLNSALLALCSGFPGFEITYSDMMENISVNISAESGTIFLSPLLMQFGQPLSSGLSINRGDGEAKDLILEGHAEVINIALQSIKYLGYCKLDEVYFLHLIKLYENCRTIISLA